MLISPVNLSEGRSRASVAAISDAAQGFCHLLDVHSDPDHNRSVVTLAGEGPALVQGILAAAREACLRIDLRLHTGVHPRIGVIDVVPFVPAAGSQLPEHAMREAIAASISCATRLWVELKIPCFLYELSAPANSAAVPLTLPALRRDAFKKLAAHVGGPEPHLTAGAAAVGARNTLVAFNVNLDATSIQHARAIAAALRRELPSVRALGLPLASRGLVQVSCNLTRPAETTLPEVFEALVGIATQTGAEILESELVGLAPRAAFAGGSPASLRLSRQPKIIEDLLEHVAESSLLEKG